MASSNTDYLRFSAYSIKDLITRKLSDNSKFTDQIYEGSNLAILIDIVSYMYQCLLFNINNAASEAMFSDTQIYENINRLCKFIGYNPKGCSTATCEFTLNNTQYEKGIKKFQSISIPRYSYIDTNKYDSNGKKIYYSTEIKEQVTSNDDYTILLYNGIWKLYSNVFAGTGQAYQTLYLENMSSDETNENYVPSDKIDVYVDEGFGPILWTRVDQGLFTDNNVQTKSSIYSQNECIYNVRLNENKQYEITFGNNFTGKAPSINSKIYIFYLDSNGSYGILDQSDVVDATIDHSASTLGITEELYNSIFDSEMTYQNDGEVKKNITKELLFKEGLWTNTSNSSAFKAEESVSEIRRNAPEWFKTGNRLVTASDWEYYVKNRFRNNILDVKCQNNWQYISTFYRWLYNLGVEQHQNSKYYINQNKLTKYAKYSDASDVNNVYLWIKMRDQKDLYTDVIDNDVQNIKTLTQEPTYLTPFTVNFAICAQEKEDARYMYFNNDNLTLEFDPENYSYLEITLDDNSLYSTQDISQQVVKKITNFFKEDNFQLGQTVDYSKLATEILSIKSISRIRTIYHNTNTNAERIINGIAFATWTNSFIDLGDDLEVSNTSRSLEDFQFPSLYKSGSILNKIKVIKKTINSINTIQY